MSDLTKRMLAQSLIRLLNQEPLSAITVQKIADGCGVNRQTFYYHFPDIYGLLEWIFEEDARRLLGGDVTYTSWKEKFLGIFRQLQKYQVPARNIYHSMSRAQLVRYLRTIAAPVVREVAESLMVRDSLSLSSEDLDLVVAMFAWTFVGLALDWLDGLIEESYESRLDKAISIMDGSMEHALKKLSRPL